MSITGKSDRRSIASARKERKQRFLAAVALTGQLQQDFARIVGVTPGHLSQVLDGKRESATLTEKVDAFIAKYLGDRAVA